MVEKTIVTVESKLPLVQDYYKCEGVSHLILTIGIQSILSHKSTVIALLSNRTPLFQVSIYTVRVPLPANLHAALRL